jgi:hypothetical protein
MEFGHSARNRSQETRNCVKLKPGILDWREIWRICYWRYWKVLEKFGFNQSNFGWFGHFAEHVACGVLGFR